MGIYSKIIKSDKYKCVYVINGVTNGKEKFKKQFRSNIMINGNVMQASHNTEREAALFVDMKRIEHGLEPVNILKRK